MKIVMIEPFGRCGISHYTFCLCNALAKLVDELILLSSINNEIKKQQYSLSMTMLLFIGELYLLKAKAFQGEFEWRLISLLIKTADDVYSFYPNFDKIKPYRAFKLKGLEINPIEEIVLGPKNITPKYVVESFLKQSGFKDVKVSSSEASYR